MEVYIDEILKEAQKAYRKDEIPVGCIIVKNGKIISKAHNSKQKTHKCINHAEIIAISKAEKKIKDWRLDDCELYVTLEPCTMCMEVIRQARIKKIYYLLDSNFNNENNKKITKIAIGDFEHKKKKYKDQISSFFSAKR